MASTLPTPFGLGVYVGGPDNANASNQAIFNNDLTSFEQVLGTAPQYLGEFIDQSQTVNNWVSNSGYAAASLAATPGGKAFTPVISLPLSSTASGSMSPDQQFQAFASGAYDGALKGIVNAWTSEGYSNLVIRPGWEFNLPGPNFAGTTPQSQADWVAAFQHVSTVLHQAAATDGANVQVVWNPGTINYSNAEATTQLYPGDAYVDAIGADVYGDIYPYSDGGATPTYHDWDTGREDTSLAQFIADPVNRVHYYTYPAATEYNNDSSGGHSLSLDNLIQFAQAHGKTFDVPETGAGNSAGGQAVADDAAFPQWLSQQLTAATAAGTKVGFVSIWDDNGGGNYQFSQPSDGKPAEAAAWAQYFGATTTAPPPASPPASPPPTTGSAPDVLDLHISEDAWQGDAQFTVAINGQTIGGTYTATALHSAGATQDFSFSGNWGAGQKTVGISFINDAYGGSASTDRNLYVDQVTYDGQAAAGTPATLYSTGTQNFTTPAGASAITVNLAEDAWQGDAQYSIAVDGQTLVQDATATALKSQGQSQAVDLQKVLTAGTHDVAVSFLNDAYGGTPTTDRNLYVTGISVNGAAQPGGMASLYSAGTQHFQITVPTS